MAQSVEQCGITPDIKGIGCAFSLCTAESDQLRLGQVEAVHGHDLGLPTQRRKHQGGQG